MDKHRKFGKNVIGLFISQIISYTLIFFYTIYLARYLGADGYGIISFAIAFSGIFTILADLGLNTLIVREVSRNTSLANKFLVNVFFMKILLSLLSFFLIIVMVNLIGYSQTTIAVVYFFSLSAILTSLFGIFYSIYQSFEKIEYQSLGLILSSILIFGGVMIGINLGFGVVRFSMVFFVSSIITLIYTALICFWKFLIPKMDYDITFWKKILKEALPFGITGISVVLYINIDSVILSILQNNEVVGFYNAAYRLVLFLVIIPSTINIAIFPLMSRYHITSKSSLMFINEKYFKLMLILGIPIGVSITILANKIIILLYGTEYINSIIALQILIWTVIFTFASAASSKLLEATNKQVIITKITIISVLLNIIINLILIPKYSYIGASIATVLTEAFVVTMILTISNRLGYGVSIKQNLSSLLKIIFASIIMGIILIYLQNINLIISIILATVIYILILIALKGINNEDLKLLKLILFNNK
jgi:O-antigen/teichoic acid export membrane protein